MKADSDLQVNNMTTHDLKLHPEYYEAVILGVKTFEIRKNDRNYKVGDKVILHEYYPDSESYSGRSVEAEITYITDYGQSDNFVVFSIKLNNEH